MFQIVKFVKDIFLQNTCTI